MGLDRGRGAYIVARQINALRRKERRLGRGKAYNGCSRYALMTLQSSWDQLSEVMIGQPFPCLYSIARATTHGRSEGSVSPCW